EKARIRLCGGSRSGSVAPSNSHFANLLHRAADRVAPERPAPHRPFAARLLRMEASMSKNGSGIDLKNRSGIELKNGSGIEPSDIAVRQIVPHDASAAAAFEEQLDRHANTIARYGTEWADRLIEE